MTDQTKNLSNLFTLPRLFPQRHDAAQEYPALAIVQSHWEAQRQGRIAPRRDDIDPRPLAEALPVTFVAEFVAPSVARIRLAGQRLYDLLGMEPRGMPLSVFLDAAGRAMLEDALPQLRQGARVLLPLHAEGSLGRPAIEAQMLLLPLIDASGVVTRVIGVLEYHGQPGRVPRALSPSAAHVASVTMPVTEMAAQPVSRPALEAAPQSMARIPAPPPAPLRRPQAEDAPRRKGPPALRVIDGGLS